MEEPPSLAVSLKAFFDVVLAETEANPAFAAKVSAVLAVVAAAPVTDASAPLAIAHETPEKPEAATAKEPAEIKPVEPDSESKTPVPFDPLYVHLEVAIMNGMEGELRGYLFQLSREELKQVTQVQRLPGAGAIGARIDAGDPLEEIIEDMIDSAVGKVRGRISAAS